MQNMFLMFNLFFGFPDNTNLESALILTIGTVRLVGLAIKPLIRRQLVEIFFKVGTENV